ncbi:MAG: BON domain-containing protein [Steroidobacteraceae bacterium]
MFARDLLTAAIAAAGLMTAIAAPAEEARRSFGEYADDKVILSKVKTALVRDATTEAGEINVEVNKGVVQLNGFVDTAKERERATAVARAVDGVKAVENNLSIKQGRTTAGQLIDDATVTARVKAALIDSPDTKAASIKVETRAGIVQLSGVVDSEAARSAATKVAAGVKGVKSVQNNLGVRN